MVAVTAGLNEQQLDDTFAALANPTRRAILVRLAEGEASVKELAEPIMSHRVILHPEAEFAGSSVEGVLARILADTPPPSERAA